MTLTKTHDVPATTAQIAALASAGCEIVRVAVPKLEDAEALPLIVRLSPLPVIADIHFNASLALKAIDAGVAAVRINPGNIGGDDKVAQVVTAAKQAGHPDADRRQLRLAAEAPRGARAGRPGRGARRGGARGGAAAREARLPRLQDLGQVEPRADDDPRLPDARRRACRTRCTSASPRRARRSTGSIKSAIGLGSLLADGIGDTIRVSLTADPVEEVKVAWEILKALGLRERGPMLIACPSCGRDNVGVADPRRGGRGAARAPTRSTSRSRCSAARSTARARRATPTSASPAAATSASSTRTASVLQEGRVGGARRRALPRDRPVDRGRHAAPEAAASMAKPAALAMAEASADPARVASLATAMIVRASQLFLPTLRDAPADAEAVSHKLLVRGGYIRQVSAGPLDVPAARLARAPQGRADHPRGDGRDRRAGDGSCRC